MNTRWTPTEDYVAVVDRPDLVVYLNPAGTTALRYVGKSAKPADYIRFRSPESCRERVATWVSWADDYAARKVERKATQAATRASLADKAPVGSLWCASWGWEQTNVNYYEVTRVMSPTVREVQEIGLTSVESTSWGSDRVIPNREHHVGDPRRVTLCVSGDAVYFYPEGSESDFLRAYEDAGAPTHRSWYS